ncbi:MAG: fumarylacetoacetate hydrolase family protein [Ignavibacteria bacterium]|nr:fumarylacetoacetate hydrolase family protein [Ignavibacteria bacterium]
MKSVILREKKEEYHVGKILCVGRNYAEHAKELGNDVPSFPIIFIKPASCIIYSGENVEYPPYSQELHHEIELVLLIGKTIRKGSIDEAEDAIIGYGVGLDMTLRDLQNEYRKEGNPWTLAKCFDTSAVLSDFVMKDSVPDILEQEITLSVNGQMRQQCLLNMMIFKPAEIVSYLSERMTLEPGDLIFTGTPKGVSALQRGDELQGKIGSLLSLNTTVA